MDCALSNNCGKLLTAILESMRIQLLVFVFCFGVPLPLLSPLHAEKKKNLTEQNSNLVSSLRLSLWPSVITTTLHCFKLSAFCLTVAFSFKAPPERCMPALKYRHPFGVLTYPSSTETLCREQRNPRFVCIMAFTHFSCGGVLKHESVSWLPQKNAEFINKHVSSPLCAAPKLSMTSNSQRTTRRSVKFPLLFAFSWEILGRWCGVQGCSDSSTNKTGISLHYDPLNKSVRDI